MSASCNTVSFDSFGDHEIRRILHRNRISVASTFFSRLDNRKKPEGAMSGE